MTFGLIAVPIKVTSATEDHTVHFHQVHATDGARIRQHRICSKEGTEVPYKEVAKGYEVKEGEYILLSDDEIAAAGGDNAHRIGLDEFVPDGDIDPVFYDRTYFLAAGDDGDEAYRLLHDALVKSERVGIGRWVFHNREYLAAVRPLDGVLALHTMRFADELVSVSDLDLPRPSRLPSKREVEMAQALVDSLHSAFSPGQFKDTYRERVLELIKRKARGETIDIPEREEPETADDLAAALEASLKGTKRRQTGTRKGTRRGGGTKSDGRRTTSSRS